MRRVTFFLMGIAPLFAAGDPQSPLSMHKACGILVPTAEHRKFAAKVELSDELRTHFRAFGSAAGVDDRDMWAPLAADYLARLYSPEEFVAVLDVQRDLVQSTMSVALSDALSGESREAGDAVILFANPLCTVCRAKLKLIGETQADCGASFPKVVVVPLAVNEEPSIRAVAMLEYIRRYAPDDFDEAVRMFIEHLPDRPGDLDRMFATYLREIGPLDSQELERLRGVTREKAKTLESLGYRSPLVIYSNRLIERHTVGKVAFDPLRSALNFAATIGMIQLNGTPPTKRQGE